MASLGELVQYCEATNCCRHQAICKYFGETVVPECDYACDWHKDAQGLKMRKKALETEEFVSTQQEQGRYEDYWSD